MAITVIAQAGKFYATCTDHGIIGRGYVAEHAARLIADDHATVTHAVPASGVSVDLDTDVYALNTIMEFDHVIVVNEDGTVSDAVNVYAPELYDGAVDQPWTLLNGYSGQHNYAGPVMHDSEFIGGGLARDILSTPGTYVAVVNNDGWAVARMA